MPLSSVLLNLLSVGSVFLNPIDFDADWPPVRPPRLIGTVAVTGTGHNEPRRTGRSGSKTEELIDETDFAYWSGLL
jgi:hypothetical protein